MRDDDNPIVIVGGGLAGSISALSLAEAEIPSIVLDKEVFPRNKICGEGLLPVGVRRLKRWLGPNAIKNLDAQPFVGIHYRCFGEEALGDFLDGHLGYGVLRSKLDAALAERCQAHPLISWKNLEVHQVHPKRDKVQIITRNGESLDTPVLVGADGIQSVVRRQSGLVLPPAQRKRYALRQHYQVPEHIPLPKRVEVSVCGGFESYMTPVAKREVGLVFLCEHEELRSQKGGKKAIFDNLIAKSPEPLRRRINASVPKGDLMTCGPMHSEAKRSTADRVILVGDAAGFVDGITGEGMSLALHGGELASEALISWHQGTTTLANAFRKYERLRSKHFRAYKGLTQILLWLSKHPIMARRAVARLQRQPELFSELLSVNQGEKSMMSIGVYRLLQLALGAKPQSEFLKPVNPVEFSSSDA